MFVVDHVDEMTQIRPKKMTYITDLSLKPVNITDYVAIVIAIVLRPTTPFQLLTLGDYGLLTFMMFCSTLREHDAMNPGNTKRVTLFVFPGFIASCSRSP